jgi:hypothetical protein
MTYSVLDRPDAETLGLEAHRMQRIWQSVLARQLEDSVTYFRNRRRGRRPSKNCKGDAG